MQPSGLPTTQPSCQPVSAPTCQPSYQPSLQPTSLPSSPTDSLPCNQVLIHPCNHPASLVGNLRNNQQFYRHGNLLMYQHLSRQDIHLHFQAPIHQRHQVDNPARYPRSNHPGNRCQIRRRNHMDIHRLNPLINP